MATFKFQGQKPFPTLSFISLTMFLLVLNKANSIETISFNYTKFHQGDKYVILQGDARITPSGVLQLSRENNNGIPIWNSTGRALYAQPVHIWDSTTDRVASFETRFSIAINQTFPYIYLPADGLAFFLAPFSSKPAKGGGLLGIFDSPYEDKQVLAVEFDTYPNPYYDPPQVPHIGLDVKSIRSIKTSPFDLDNGKVANVVVTYHASSKILHAALVYPSQGTIYTVAEIVDVKKVLPEWVYVGFSASTGDTPNAAETHDVLSWSFTSTLAERNDIVIATLQNHTTNLVQQ